MAVRRLRVDCGPEAVDRVVEFVDELSRDAGLDKGPTYWFRLAADEISTNICDHGYCGGSGPLDLEGSVDDGRVSVQIEDDAPAFDPRQYDRLAQLEVDPRVREEGGHGLMLALAKVDEFDYDLVQGRNRNTLTMLRPDRPETPEKPDASDSAG